MDVENGVVLEAVRGASPDLGNTCRLRCCTLVGISDLNNCVGVIGSAESAARVDLPHGGGYLLGRYDHPIDDFATERISSHGHEGSSMRDESVQFPVTQR